MIILFFNTVAVKEQRAKTQRTKFLTIINDIKISHQRLQSKAFFETLDTGLGMSVFDPENSTWLNNGEYICERLWGNTKIRKQKNAEKLRDRVVYER